ncbi:MAG: CoA-binding protein, partial [bacterium]
IILITGGMGEKEGKKEIENRLRKVIIDSRSRPDKGPVMVGGNSLGIISGPGGYDTMFVTESKLPKNPDLPIGKKIALISQSGAFMITRMSKLGGILPRYAISTGNQVDLGIADFLWHCLTDKGVKVIGCYIEGFKDGEGMRFADAVQGVSDKDIVVYKAGRSDEGRKAASGHTAALAGDWNVADAVLKRAGCIVTHTFDEYTDLLMLCSMLSGHWAGANRLAVISGAGYETVGMADNLRSPDYKFEFADISEVTRERIHDALKKYRLDGLVDIRNPIDLTPMAVDAAHVEILKSFADDPSVDIILDACVPLSPAMKTREKGGPEGDGIEDPNSFASLVIEASRNIRKPLVLVVDSGKLYDPMVEMLMNAGIPVFRSADRAIKTLGLWAKNKFGGPR